MAKAHELSEMELIQFTHSRLMVGLDLMSLMVKDWLLAL